MTPSSIRILPLGDSITKGSANPPGGYRGFLGKSLLASGVAFEFVGNQQVNSEGMRYPRHEGHPGGTIQQLRLGRESVHSNSAPIQQTLRECQPDCVLLLAGTNDLYYACPEATCAEMASLIQEMFQVSPDLLVIIGTVLPILPGPKPWGGTVPEDVTERVNNFNQRLAQLVREQAALTQSIFLADFPSCVHSAEDLMADGVHPKSQVMERMAKIWHDSLIRRFESRAKAAT